VQSRTGGAAESDATSRSGRSSQVSVLPGQPAPRAPAVAITETGDGAYGNRSIAEY
jgi:hypothetical protein